MHGNRRRSVLGAAVGAGLGLLAGIGVLAAASGAGVGRVATSPPRVEATHLPPLLTILGEPVTLRYDVYCVGSDDPAAECDAGGTVYVRAGDSGQYEALPLRLDPAAVDGRYAARVPPALVRSGFSYYAVLRDARTGASTTLPESGAAAPETSVPLGDSTISVDLGEHAFGRTRRADARVVSAPWGDGAGEVGLEETGPDATPIGASSFDVDGSGRVTVLDEAHGRCCALLQGRPFPPPFRSGSTARSRISPSAPTGRPTCSSQRLPGDGGCCCGHSTRAALSSRPCLPASAARPSTSGLTVRSSSSRSRDSGGLRAPEVLPGRAGRSAAACGSSSTGRTRASFELP